MEINNAIFDMVKSNLSGDINPEIFLKICLGTATEEEREEANLSDEVVEKLKKCCDVGYNMASSLDKEKSEIAKLKDEITGLKCDFEILKNETNELRKLVNILTKQCPTLYFEEVVEEIDPENYTQYI